MGELEFFIGCKIKHDLTKMNLKIYQLHLITNTTKGLTKT